jgi:hypothetical protein
VEPPNAVDGTRVVDQTEVGLDGVDVFEDLSLQ